MARLFSPGSIIKSRQTVTKDATSSTTSYTISSVDTSKTVLHIHARGGGNDGEVGMDTAALTSSTNVEFYDQRRSYGVAGSQGSCTVEVIEYY